MSSLTIEDQNRTEFRFSPIVGAAIISALGAVLLTELLLARRVSLILNITLPILAGVALLSMRLRFQNRRFGFLKPFLLTLCFFSPVLVGAKSVLYLFPGSPLFTFKPIVLIIGFIAAVFAAVRFGFMEDREAPIIAAILILTFFFVSVFADAYAKHFNYLLDSSEPTVYTVEIADKETHVSRHRGKRRTSYSVKVLVEGKPYSVNVSETEYNGYEIGDPYSLDLYGGAFGKPFVIPK